jgi:hypothetical protein
VHGEVGNIARLANHPEVALFRWRIWPRLILLLMFQAGLCIDLMHPNECITYA